MTDQEPSSLRQTLSRAARKVWAVPGLVADAARQRRHERLLADLKAERLDRIRNPSKYLGK